MPGALVLGLMAAVLAWVPFVGSVIGCVIVVLVAATDFPADPWVVYAAVALFLFVRLLDDFVFMPLTVGRSLHMHPLPTVLLIFVGGAVAGSPRPDPRAAAGRRRHGGRRDDRRASSTIRGCALGTDLRECCGHAGSPPTSDPDAATRDGNRAALAPARFHIIAI